MNGETHWQWVSTALTHVGNVRALNEDAILDMPQRGLWAVADGMGGHQAGELASSRIVASLAAVNADDAPGELVDRVEDHLKQVNYELFMLSRQGGSSTVIGSTVVALIALQGYCVCMWAGDSRVYRMRDALLEQLTVDHSEVEELIAQGHLDRSEADGHPGENIITRAVGGDESVDLEMRLVPLQNRDRFLLCSDGLYKEVTDEEIAAAMVQGSTADVTGKLMAAALSRRCADNVSLITVDFEQRWSP